MSGCEGVARTGRGPLDRETAVLALLARGASRRRIVDELSCSAATVDRIVVSIRARYRVRTTVQAVVAAVRAGDV